MKYTGLLLLLIIVFARTSVSEWESELSNELELYDSGIRVSNVSPQVVGLILEGIALVWNGLCQIFGTSIKTQIIDVAVAKGFSFFDSSYTIDLTAGFKVSDRSMEKLKSYYQTVLWPEGKDSEEMADALVFALILTQRNVWSENDVIFKASNGNMVYSAVMTQKIGEDKFNIITINSNAKFQLSKEMSILKKITQVGFLYEGVTTEIIYKDRAIEEADINGLMYFLQMTAYKAVANSQGMSLEYPK